MRLRHHYSATHAAASHALYCKSRASGKPGYLWTICSCPWVFLHNVHVLVGQPLLDKPIGKSLEGRRQFASLVKQNSKCNQPIVICCLNCNLRLTLASPVFSSFHFGSNSIKEPGIRNYIRGLNCKPTKPEAWLHPNLQCRIVYLHASGLFRGLLANPISGVTRSTMSR